MSTTTHSARVTGPLPYIANGGERVNIPLGPCLLEQLDSRSVDIIWGPMGQWSTALPLEAVTAAAGQGHLVLLD